MGWSPAETVVSCLEAHILSVMMWPFPRRVGLHKSLSKEGLKSRPNETLPRQNNSRGAVGSSSEGSASIYHDLSIDVEHAVANTPGTGATSFAADSLPARAAFDCYNLLLTESKPKTHGGCSSLPSRSCQKPSCGQSRRARRVGRLQGKSSTRLEAICSCLDKVQERFQRPSSDYPVMYSWAQAWRCGFLKVIFLSASA